MPARVSPPILRVSRRAACGATELLLTRFQRQRPLRAGSLLVTIFGDAILPRGGAVSLGSLIGLGAPFGLNERLVRTAAARLAQEGWLEARRVGKLSEYQLSAHGRERFAEATLRIYGPPQGAWSGRWTLIVIPPMKAARRNALKKELLWRGCGEIAAHLFAHPDSGAPSAAELDRELADEVMVFEAQLANADPRKLAALGWDLKELAARYRRFVKDFEAVRGLLGPQRDLDPNNAFIVRTLLIHEYRRLHLRDPMLPVRLLQPQWPGLKAATLCRDLYARIFDASECHLNRVGADLRGPLRPPDATVLTRFGGFRD